jgi:tRNA A-37 threonylcarbamoyl transferase component Bud32
MNRVRRIRAREEKRTARVQRARSRMRSGMASIDDDSFLRQVARTPELPPPAEAPERLGRFRIVERIGRGGMGVVYRARDEQLRRDVAVKLVLERNPDRLRRFATEAKAAAALSHPNVLAVFDVSIEGEPPYLVTELLEGRTLAELLAEGPLPLKRTLALATQLASGLGAAHARNIVHRDLKPSNLFVVKDGTLKILDFGLAKVVEPVSGDGETATAQAQTQDGSVLGTAGYMAPEQVAGRAADVRSDLFAFGCVLYEMLSGKRAFDGPTRLEVSYKTLRDDPAPLPETIPPPLRRIVERLLQKDPEQRLQSARDVAFALEEIEAPTMGVAPVPRRRSSRRAALLASLALAAVAAAFVAGHTMHARPQPVRYTRLTYRLGAIGSARFVPGSTGVLYTATVDGRSQVFSAVPGNPEARPLFEPGAILAGVSPKGELALLLKGGAPEAVLARAALAGGSPRPILDQVVFAHWLPNDELLAVRAISGRRRVEWPIGHVALETDAWRLAAIPSPRGDLVALIELRLPSYQTGRIELLDRHGARRALTRTYRAIGGAVWTPDGREIWYIADESPSMAHTLRAVTLDGRERVIAEFPEAMAIRDIAPDGRVLLSVETFHHRIAGVVPGRDYERDLSWFEGSDRPELSPDGKRLLSTVLADSGDATYLREGDTAVQLGPGNAMALSPDGKWAVAGTGALYSELELQPTGAGASRKLPRGPLELVTRVFFFPDGARIAVVGREPNRPLRIWIQELGGGDPRPFSDEGVITACDPSPDGRWIAALDAARRPLLLSTDGGAPRPLPQLGENDLPIAWSATGGLYVRRLERVERLDGYVSTGAPVKIDHLDLASGARTKWRELVPGEPAGSAHIDDVSITPDGRYYAYASGTFSSVLFVAEGLR